MGSGGRRPELGGRPTSPLIRNKTHMPQRSRRTPGVHQAKERSDSGTGVRLQVIPEMCPSHSLGSPTSVCSLNLWPSREEGPELARLPEFLVWLRWLKEDRSPLANACTLRFLGAVMGSVRCQGGRVLSPGNCSYCPGSRAIFILSLLCLFRYKPSREVGTFHENSSRLRAHGVQRCLHLPYVPPAGFGICGRARPRSCMERDL